MATKNATIQIKRGTSAKWNGSSYILAQGEFGFATDTKELKIGNGSSTWVNLEGYVLKDDVKNNTSHIAIVSELSQNAIINLSGKSLTSYKAVFFNNTYPYYEIRTYDNKPLTESEIKQFLRTFIGNTFYSSYNYDTPIYSYVMTASKEVYKIQNDNGNLRFYYCTTLGDKLISGSNIKTINNQSILGSGNITIGGGSSNLYNHHIQLRIQYNHEDMGDLYFAFDYISNYPSNYTSLDDMCYRLKSGSLFTTIVGKDVHNNRTLYRAYFEEGYFEVYWDILNSSRYYDTTDYSDVTFVDYVSQLT